MDPDTQDPGNGSLGLGNGNPETQNPESRTLKVELVTQIPSIQTHTRLTLLSTIGNINYKLLENTDSNLTQTLLFGNTSFDNATINFILLTKRFDEPFF